MDSDIQPTRTYRHHGPQPFPPGTPIGVITVIAAPATAVPLRQRQWVVRYGCCGLEAVRNYSTLLHYLNDPAQRCRSCEARDRLTRAPARAPAPPPDIDPVGAWPRPPSLVGQAPVVWGVQP